MMGRKIIVTILVYMIVQTGIGQLATPGQTFDAKKLDAARQEAVLLNNASGLIPLQQLSTMQIATVYLAAADAVASRSTTDTHTIRHRRSAYRVFDSIANKYWKVHSIFADTAISDSLRNILHDKLKLFDHVIFYISGSHAGTNSWTSLITSLKGDRKAAVVINGDKDLLLPYADLQMPLIWCPDGGIESASIAAQVIFGGQAVTNKLSAAVGKKFKKGQGDITSKIRLGYGVPASLGLNENFSAGIDSIVDAAIATHAAPGVVVLLVKNGQVIFDKAFGKRTYDATAPLRSTDIFDMASVTKVTATTPTIMRLYDQKLLSLDTPISHFVQALQNYPDKKDLTVREALLHEAGFTPYIKFYEKLGPLDLSFHRSEAFPTEIADNFFLRRNYFEEVMWPVTLQSPVLTRGKFVYSDVSMYMMKEVAENITHRRLDEYVLNDLYLPLGMQFTGYLPRLRFDESRIVPTTENDNWLRNMRVTGFVNDPGAAMAGGVEGHAGLFATSNDLAIYYQMMLNKGEYGGRRFLKAGTVDLFTSRQSKVSTRGLGFAKPIDSIVPPVGYPSASSFGHSGYTGTYVWVDPAYDIIYVCLTNRVYPDDGKTYGPAKVNIRAQLLDMFYNAVVKQLKK
jgi:CubicO group peptidase (beta-lactamase class C family)